MTNLHKQEAEHLLGLLHSKDKNEATEPLPTGLNLDDLPDVGTYVIQRESSPELFVDEELSEKAKKIAYSKIQKMNAKSPRRSGPVISEQDIKVDLEHSVVTVGKETWLIPADIAKIMRDKSEDALDLLPQSDLEDLEPIPTGEPGYWVTVYMTDGSSKHLPVYGYMADLGRSAAGSPRITDEWYWDNTEWLCRCAQCGRELPPMYFFVNTSGHPVGICKACTSINKVTARVMQYPRKYWRPDEEALMERMAYLHQVQWRRGLSPRGEYAEHLLGKGEVQYRINRSRYQRKKPKEYERHAQASTVAKHLQLTEELNGTYNDNTRLGAD